MQFAVGEAEFEILIVGKRTVSRFEKCGSPGQIVPTLYVQTRAPLTMDLCDRATASLSKRLRVSHISVNYRKDSWFVLGSSFPVVYPYAPPSRPPTELEHQESPQVICETTGCPDQAKCVQYLGLPISSR